MPTRETASTGFARRPTGCQPGCLHLSAYLRALFGLGDSGCFNPSSTMSSGAPSWHVYGKAIDLGCNWYDRAARARGDACFAWVLAHANELNLQQMIFGERIWDVSYGGIRTYRHDDHKNHVHIAIGYVASQTWSAPGAPTTPTPPPAEDDMFEKDDAARLHAVEMLVTQIDQRVAELVNAAYPGGDTGQKSRLRLIAEGLDDVKRALFPNGGNVAKTSRPATIAAGIQRILTRLGDEPDEVPTSVGSATK